MSDESSPPVCSVKGCGKPMKYVHETRCEDCWADDQQKFHGKDRSVEIPFRSKKDSEAVSPNKFNTPR